MMVYRAICSLFKRIKYWDVRTQSCSSIYSTSQPFQLTSCEDSFALRCQTINWSSWSCFFLVPLLLLQGQWPGTEEGADKHWGIVLCCSCHAHLSTVLWALSIIKPVLHISNLLQLEPQPNGTTQNCSCPSRDICYYSFLPLTTESALH